MARRLIPRAAAMAAAMLVVLPGFAQATPGATASDDRISGTARADVISGRGGDDVLHGRGGADRLSGEGGNDTLTGGGGRDRLAGGAGDDLLRGDGAADILNGGRGDDLVRARDASRDRVLCGPGRDVAIVDARDVVLGCEIVRRSPAAKPLPLPSDQSLVPAGPSGPVSAAPAPEVDPVPDPDPDPDPGPDPDPDPDPDPGPDPDPDPDPDPGPDPNAPQLVAAGDIADCTEGAELTAALLDNLPGTVATLGDAAYPTGSVEDFANCYDPTWGRHRARTRPAIGSHEYETLGAYPYFSYFGEAAGDPHTGYYSYDLGGWHIVVLNSNCGEVGGCDEDSPQVAWLRADLAANPALCTAAYWHNPRFSSGMRHGSDLNMRTFFQVLYEHGVEFVMGGNDHHYERFGLQTPDGDADPTDGIRQFVVGTGGRFLRPVQETPEPNSEAIDNTSFGVLRVGLMSWGYEWEFVPAEGSTFTDSGIGGCH